ncbi:transmembrane protein 169 [Anopheles ziemanni]|uniref:transmembrane protein 169 n=1 Tax=Anopheles coustani TaxID=139045 RepID=UPI002657EC08|nr:transmembrane protein 169 [Anopheles coustani]XP_058172884.1 transmembrane protein 169 [Anopheles ziemanni]
MVGLTTDDMVVRVQQQQPSPNRLCQPTMVGGGQSEFPVFIPPRKRQTGKKANHGNHIDHIVNLQGTRKEWDLTPEREDCRKNKRWNSEEIIETTANSKVAPNGTNEDEDDLNELQQFHPLKDSSTVTPSSISESSLDRKSSKSAELLTGGSSKRSKKRVNIRTDLDEIGRRRSPSAICNYEDLESGETSVLNADLDQQSLERYNTTRSYSSSTDNYLTMTGTIKRGRKKGQSIDVQLNISREELEQISKQALAVHDESYRSGQDCCTLRTGVHILLLSLVCLPFVTLTTGIYSFYMGTVTWYNMFTYFNEERSYFHKLLMSPLLILAYPLCIVLCTIGLALYAGVRQISFHFRAWLNEVSDIEKGFYGWLCSFLHLSDCSPYEVVILTDICPTNLPPGGPGGALDAGVPGHRAHPGDGRLQGESTQINSSTEELSV